MMQQIPCGHNVGDGDARVEAHQRTDACLRKEIQSEQRCNPKPNYCGEHQNPYDGPQAQGKTRRKIEPVDVQGTSRERGPVSQECDQPCKLAIKSDSHIEAGRIGQRIGQNCCFVKHDANWFPGLQHSFPFAFHVFRSQRLPRCDENDAIAISKAFGNSACPICAGLQLIQIEPDLDTSRL